ncbi:hypothetical protein COOONC_21178 [Cooperia oncophora]
MSLKSLLSTPLVRAARVNESVYDGVILVTNCGKNVAETPQLKELSAAVLDFIEVHRGALTSANIVPVDRKIIPSGRLVLAGTGTFCWRSHLEINVTSTLYYCSAIHSQGIEAS